MYAQGKQVLQSFADRKRAVQLYQLNPQLLLDRCHVVQVHARTR